VTTKLYTTNLDMSSDAGFRAWGVEFSAAMATIGMVQTADSGQINWTTVIRPAGSSNAGYEIWRFDDTNHTAAPIVIRIDYGCDNAVTRPRMMLTIGTGSNGSGTITGVLKTTTQVSRGNSNVVSSITNYPTYMCCVDGFLGVCWKGGGSDTGRAYAFFSIGRTVDDTGAPTTAGIVLNLTFANGAGNSPGYAETWMFATGYNANSGTSSTPITNNLPCYAFIPYSLTATIIAGSPGARQIFRHYHPTPLIRPYMWLASSTITDAIVDGTTFSLTPVGTTPRTFMCLGTWATANERMCMMWE